MTKIFLSACLALTLLVGGCMGPLRPGRSSFSSAGSMGVLKQSQNPQQESKQVFKRTYEEPVAATPASPRIISESIETTIGAAQKDTAREMAAKLGSLRPVMWVGILLFLFGAASFVYPPLKAIVGGSVTTSAVLSLSGLAMIILPSLIVGNELLILGGGVGVAVLYWFSHRHGKLQGFVDANQDGIDDREETK